MKTFSTAMMEDSITYAEEAITKWALHGSSNAVTSLFHEDRRDEARSFLAGVSHLRRALHFFVSQTATPATSLLLSKAQQLMVSAMARLQKEFYHILSSSAGAHNITTTVAMDDLRSIAGCMVSCGYSKECVHVYRTVRRSAVDEGLYRLGHIPQTPSQVKKLDWEAAEREIASWVAASRPAVRTLFARERSLCDQVFGSTSSDLVKELVFLEVAGEPAARFLRFPEMLCTKRKSSPEKIFHYLDLHESISEIYPEIESIFSYRTTAAVPSQARAALAKLGEFVRSSLADFELAIQKESSKMVVPGGGVHPITRYVMNYLCLLADYTGALEGILAEHREGPNEEDVPVVSTEVLYSRVAWVVVLLLCNLDSKAELYKDAALLCLFMANNVRYVANKVCTSGNLRGLLGDEWVEEHVEKARCFARRYERLRRTRAGGGEDGAVRSRVRGGRARGCSRIGG